MKNDEYFCKNSKGMFCHLFFNPGLISEENLKFIKQNIAKLNFSEKELAKYNYVIACLDELPSGLCHLYTSKADCTINNYNHNSWKEVNGRY